MQCDNAMLLMAHLLQVHLLDAPPYDVVLKKRATDWKPEEAATLKELRQVDAAFKCHLEARVKKYYEAWEREE